MTTVRSRRSRKPVRLVHLGLGGFFRAHQARFTQLAEDGDDWGYAAFTVRSPRQAELLRDQDCLYTLIERSREGDDVAIVDQLSTVHDGADLDALRGYLRDPAVAVVPCDNLPGNGEIARHAVVSFAADQKDLVRWVYENVSFVSTAVDRITPRLSAEDSALAAARSGCVDASAARQDLMCLGQVVQAPNVTPSQQSRRTKEKSMPAPCFAEAQSHQDVPGGCAA